MSRELIQRAIIDTIAEGGIAGLSVRAVASRADVAIGTVQHHYRSRTDMLLAAMENIIATTGLEHGRSPDKTTESQLHTLIDLMLPSPDRTTVARVWLAFAAQAAVDPTVAERYQDIWHRTRRGLTELLAEARPHASWAQAESAATELLALLDGLTVSVLAEPRSVSPDTARSIAGTRLRALLADVG
ncbi:TetR/AcrR family transcriptional regulator [Brachybacterium sp. GCM10030267]|uniref:TetR/AcrR family transcriptional regulator n=1 Tax=unclassified Brachybacterium TaxID=2623841 RepID=UPI003611AAAB